MVNSSIGDVVDGHIDNDGSMYGNCGTNVSAESAFDRSMGGSVNGMGYIMLDGDFDSSKGYYIDIDSITNGFMYSGLDGAMNSNPDIATNRSADGGADENFDGSMEGTEDRILDSYVDDAFENIVDGSANGDIETE